MAIKKVGILLGFLFILWGGGFHAVRMSLN